MRKIGIVVLLMTFAVGSTLMAAPQIHVDKENYDFGEVREGVIVTHAFIISNTGDEPLVISDVWASCGCTTTALTKRTLAPGETVELEAILNTAGIQGPTGKTVYVESNDPDTPSLTLRLIGSIQSGAELQAYHIPAEDLKYWFYVLIDLRNTDAYEASHIIGAVNLPYEDMLDWVRPLPKDTIIIVYDEDGSLGDRAAQALNDTGFPNAKSLFGGFNEWLRQFRGKYLMGVDVAEDEPS